MDWVLTYLNKCGMGDIVKYTLKDVEDAENEFIRVVKGIEKERDEMDIRARLAACDGAMEAFYEYITAKEHFYG